MTRRVPEDPQGVAFDEIEVGARGGPYPLVVDAAAVATYHAVTGGEGPADRVPPLLLVPLQPLKALVDIPVGSLHVEDELRLLRPVRSGEPLEAYVEVVERRESGDRRHVVFEQSVSDASGAVVAAVRRRVRWAL